MYIKVKSSVLLIMALALSIITSCDNGTAPSHESETEKNGNSKNILPICDAGADQTISTDFVILNGTGQDSDGYIVSYKWTKLQGNEDCIIYNADSSSTAVTGLKIGIYIFLLTVTDNAGGIRSDYTTVAVRNKNMIPPTCDAGDNQTIILPTNSLILNGTAQDSDGTIIAYKWTALLGPGVNETVVIANDASASTTVSGLQKGAYVFMLTVTDNDDNKYSDSVTVIVKE
jgi:hypothetical protein